MKQTFLNLTCVIILIMITLNACEKDPEPGQTGRMVSAGKQIIYFKTVTPAATGVLDTINKKISVSVPSGTSLTSIATDISLAEGHTISPASGAAQNFTNPVVYTVTRPDKSTTPWTVTVAVSDVIVEQNITQSVTWTADKTYLINKEINIDNSSVLTIEPGTVIKFGAAGYMSIGYTSNATIIANGTAEKPITFTSSALAPAAGAWQGLHFYGKTLNNSSLAYCRIQYAGSNPNYGALTLSGCDIAMNNCTVSNSGSYGIHTSYDGTEGGFVTFANNTINKTAKYGLVIHAQKIGALGTGNTFTDAIGINIDGSYRSSTAQTWKNHGVPYIVDGELDIDGTLTIAPGTSFRFDNNGWIEVGYNDATTFTADGSAATTPITFTSNSASPVAGAWKGLIFYDNTQQNSKMNFCIVDYAGSVSYQGAVHMSSGASFIFTNNIIRNSGSYGITLPGDAGFKTFTDNKIENCVNHVIDISTKHLPDLGSPNVLTAAAGKGIRVTGNAQYTTLVTWKKQTADFYIDGGGDLDIDGDITIEAGNRFRFVNDSYFWFGYYANTRVTAKGTATSKIYFTSAALSPAAGTWKGLMFDSKMQVNSEISYCDFTYSGMTNTPAIYTEVSFPVNNTSIASFSSTHAAEYKTGITAPAGTGNNFTWFAN